MTSKIMIIIDAVNNHFFAFSHFKLLLLDKFSTSSKLSLFFIYIPGIDGNKLNI
jgi:hypothetical protein